MTLGRGFHWLMIFDAALTFAATVLLTISPETIPGLVGFPTVRNAVLFFVGRKIQDAHALRLTHRTGVTFHVASALAQLYAVVQGLAGYAVWASITLRAVLAGLLLYYGFVKRPGTSAAGSPAAPS